MSRHTHRLVTSARILVTKTQDVAVTILTATPPIELASWGYNTTMETTTGTSPSQVDESLLDWFFELTPDQRLAELESRVAFFKSARQNDDDSELSQNP
jgi:hypothetical protein